MRARVARNRSVEVISKVDRTAVRRSLHRLVRYFDYWISPSKRKIYSSVSSPLPWAKSLFSSIILKSHFCNTLIDLMLSFAGSCEKWPMGNFLKQFFEGLSCDSLAPVLFSKPISDLKFSFLGVARNMTSYLLSSKNRLFYDSSR